MGMPLYRKSIYCPNCKYEGPAEARTTGGLLLVLAVISVIVGFLFWPFFLVAGLFVITALFRPSKQLCPKCKWQNPIPQSHYQDTQAPQTSSSGDSEGSITERAAKSITLALLNLFAKRR